ncbi:MAG: hypothetical protein R3F62_06725 [Planctomycetota bacterium]
MDLSGQVLFTSKSLKRDVPGKDLPQAIRPAVEIIARLSAERARLRDDVERLQEELRRARAADTAKLRAELESMRHERDELRSKVRELRRERTGRVARQAEVGGDPAALTALVARLEAAVDRLEGASPTLPPPSRHASPRPAPSRGSGGGMLAGLVQENAKLRSTPRVQGPRPGGGGGGGGMLAGLVRENAKLRETPRQAPRQASGGGGMLAGLVQENATLREAPPSAPPADAPEPAAVALDAESTVAAAEAADDASIQPRKQSFARSLAAVLGLGGRGRDVEEDLSGERQAG